MTAVDLHPEDLFDALRVGSLSPVERSRLEAHCDSCSACRFELQWLESNVHSAAPTPADREIAEIAFNRMSPATRPSAELSNTRLPRQWPLRRIVGGFGLGTSLVLALVFGREHWVGSTAPVARDDRTASTPRESELDSSPPTSIPLEVDFVPAPSPLPVPAAKVTKRATANALLAAARRAQIEDDPSRARRLYRSVIHEYPEAPAADAARVALGRLDYELADAESALPLFEDYLRRHPGGALAEEALYYRARSLERLGRQTEARTALRKLLQAFPGSVYAAQARDRLMDGRRQ